MTDPTTPSDKAAGETSSPTSSEGQANAGSSAPELGHHFEEFRKKLMTQISDLGHHVDGLQHLLTEAATQARSAIEKELSDLKSHHPEAFARLDGLRTSGDESLESLRRRLDTLAGDLEKAVGGFLNTLAEQAKKAAKHHADAADAGSPAPAQTGTEPSHPAADAPSADKPANS